MYKNIGSHCCDFQLQKRAMIELKIRVKMKLIVEDRVRSAVSKYYLYSTE